MSDDVVKYDERGVLDGATVGLPRKMSRDIWLKEVFPEWGTYLNYEIDQYKVKPGNRSHVVFRRALLRVEVPGGGGLPGGPLCRAEPLYRLLLLRGLSDRRGGQKFTGCGLNPHVVDPGSSSASTWSSSLHHHQDHMDFYTISAALQTTTCKFVGPPETCRRLKKNMGVPEDRLIVGRGRQSLQSRT